MSKECDCGKGHRDQITDFPLGGQIQATTEISSPGEALDIPAGTVGTVAAHCQDGRAYVGFDGFSGKHTFHFPHDFIERVVSQ